MTTTTTTSRAALTLVSGQTYYAVWRDGVQGLEGDWSADARGEYRPFVPCRWTCRHGGVQTSRIVGDGQPNIDHGAITITLTDGRELTGSYSAGDQWMAVTID
jgi:hypothetical protein